MNWAKGIFRVWIVMSGLWIVAIGALNNTPRDIVRVLDANAELGLNRGIITRAAVTSAIEDAIRQNDLDREVRLRELSSQIFTDGEAIKTSDRVRFDRALNALISDMTLLFVPSAALGFILFGIWWIAGGFAARKKD